MASQEADDSFRTFQRTGDTRALARVFDLLAPELLLVAAHVARGSAEDLVQSTFLHAIEAASRYDPSRPVLPWLVGILVKKALQEHRRTRRRPDPERVAMGAEPDPLAAAQDAEFADRFADVLGRLPAIYRLVLTLRLVHGLGGVEIAHSLGCSPETVKTRLRRGLEILRDRLPVGLSVPALLVVGSGPALAAVRGVVLSRAGELANQGGGLAPGGVPLLHKATAIFGLCMAGCLAWIVALGQPRTPSDPLHAGVVLAAEREQRPEDGPGGSGSPEPAVRTRIEDRDLTRSGTLRIRVVFAEDGSAAPGVFVGMVPRFVANPTLHERWVRTGGDGTVLVAELAPGSFRLTADRGGDADAEVGAGVLRDVTIRIPRGLAVAGRVVDAAGRPCPSATVWLSRKEAFDEGHEVAETDAHGAFHLRSVEAGRSISAVLPGWQPAAVLPLEGGPGDHVEVCLALERPGVALAGVVRDAEGRPVAGATVLVGNRFFRPASPFPLGATTRRPPPQTLTTDARGEFHTASREPGAVHLWVRADGFAPWAGLEGGARVEVRLEQGATLSGTVADGGGRFVPRARIEVTDEELEPPGLPFLGPDWGRSVGWSAADGTFSLAGVRPGVLHVRAFGAGGARATARLTAVRGEHVRWDAIVTPPRSISGRLRGTGGALLAGWHVKATGPRGRMGIPRATTDALGAFTIPDCEECPYVLAVHEPASAWSGPAVTLVDVVPGAGSLDVTVPDESLASAHIEGAVLGVTGSASICVTRANAGASWAVTDAVTGRFRTGPLPAGTYRLAFYLDGQLARIRGPVHLSPNAVVDCGEVRIERAGWLRVRLQTAAGNALAGGSAVVAGTDGVNWTRLALAGGSSRSEPLQPGQYLLYLGGDPLTRLSRAFEVLPGEETRLDVVVPSGALRSFTVGHPEDGSDLILDWRWFDGAGRMFCRDQTTWFRNVDTGRTVSHRFAPGSYRVEVTSHAGRCATASFEVPDLVPVDAPIGLDLR